MIVNTSQLNKNIDEFFDVAIVGSGAGGSPAAYELSKNGYSVAVLEEGGFFPTESIQASTIAQKQALYRDNGLTAAIGKPNIKILEGKAIGGSTVINSGIAQRIPIKVLKRWQWESGIKIFNNEYIDPIFSKVEKILNAHREPKTIFKHNNVLTIGAEKLGYKYNINKKANHECVGTNWCAFGCPTGSKDSVLVNYIPLALKKGCTYFTHSRIKRLIFDGRRVVGVSGDILTPERPDTKYQIKIRAKVVLLACGALQTPILLLRNKIKTESNLVGQNLFLHPFGRVLAVFDDEVSAFEKVISGVEITEFNDRISMFNTFLPPSEVSAMIPQIGFKSVGMIREYIHNGIMACVMLKDSGRGQIKTFPFDLNIPFYKINNYDFKNLLYGFALLSEICFLSGAKKVYLPIHGFDVLRGIDEIHKVFSNKIKPKDIELNSAHLMGTCRMGSEPQNSVTNGRGEIWGLENLFICDSSLFPSPIGVNPQLTIMTLSTHIAREIINSHEKLFLS
jgi:choline dehydrogenase-like flavoprotein